MVDEVLIKKARCVQISNSYVLIRQILAPAMYPHLTDQRTMERWALPQTVIAICYWTKQWSLAYCAVCFVSLVQSNKTSQSGQSEATVSPGR